MEYNLKLQDFVPMHTIFLTGEITESSVAAIEEKINEIITEDDTKYSDNISSLKQLGDDFIITYNLSQKFQLPTIKLIISSPGGCVRYGLGLYDFIKHINEQGRHKIIIEINGVAASMATIIMLASDVRSCGVGCSFMVHSIYNIAYGKIQEIRDDLAETERLNNIVRKIYKERTNISDELLDRLEKEKIDYWFDAYKAKELGFITEIIS